MVEDLRRLITTSSDQERPLMFIGSELGAMIARFYTQIYHTYGIKLKKNLNLGDLATLELFRSKSYLSLSNSGIYDDTLVNSRTFWQA